MKIYKKYNNNVAQTYDDDRREYIVIGSGIAFNKTVGSWIDESKIEKRFLLQNTSQIEHITNLLAEIPTEQFELSERIISFAEEYLNVSLNSNIHVTLADHISFALVRLNKGFEIKNPLLLDIKRIYEKEYVVGLYALDLIEKEVGVTLPEDEAGFIVMHIVDAKMNQSNMTISNTSKITDQALKIIKYKLKLNIDESGLTYRRFITHLNFFAQRVIKGEKIESIGNALSSSFIKNYPESFEGAKLICSFVEENYNYEVSEDELFYLALHLQRFTQKL